MFYDSKLYNLHNYLIFVKVIYCILAKYYPQGKINRFIYCRLVFKHAGDPYAYKPALMKINIQLLLY